MEAADIKLSWALSMRHILRLCIRSDGWLCNYNPFRLNNAFQSPRLLLCILGWSIRSRFSEREVAVMHCWISLEVSWTRQTSLSWLPSSPCPPQWPNECYPSWTRSCTETHRQEGRNCTQGNLFHTTVSEYWLCKKLAERTRGYRPPIHPQSKNSLLMIAWKVTLNDIE